MSGGGRVSGCGGGGIAEGGGCIPPSPRKNENKSSGIVQSVARAVNTLYNIMNCVVNSENQFEV